MPSRGRRGRQADLSRLPARLAAHLDGLLRADEVHLVKRTQEVALPGGFPAWGWVSSRVLATPSGLLALEAVDLNLALGRPAHAAQRGLYLLDAAIGVEEQFVGRIARFLSNPGDKSLS